MDDGLLLLAAISARPHDDTPRLVYADWLEKNANSMPDRKPKEILARAEFIRLQITQERVADDRERELARERAEKFLHRYRVRWRRPIPGEVDFRRGFVHRLVIRSCSAWAADFLASSPHLAGITELLIPDSPVDDTAIAAIAASPYTASIGELYLSGCQNVGDTGAEAIATSPIGTRIRSLDLSGTSLADAGLTRLIETATRLVSLKMHGTKVTEAGILALANATHLTALTSIGLPWNVGEHLHGQGSEVFLTALRAARGLARRTGLPDPLPSLTTLNDFPLPRGFAPPSSRRRYPEDGAIGGTGR